MDLMYLIFILFVASVSSATISENDKLISVTQVFRHGERTPILFYSTDPYKDKSYWNGLGTGQLTENGKVQLIKLGQYFRKRYGNFLSTKYLDDEIYVTTVNGDRNYISAESFLYGLYPGEIDDIPIKHTSSAIMGGLVECLHYDMLFLKLEFYDEYFRMINDKNSEVYQHIRENSIFPVYELLGAYYIWDTLHTESRFNYTLPEWTNLVFPHKLTELTNAFASSLCYTEEQQRLSVGPFLNNLINYFESVILNPSSTQKVQLYSVHDLNIACLLNTFEASEPHIPDFASSIVFELLKTSNGEHYVNAYYKPRDEAIPITLKGCDFNCKIDELKNIFRNLRISELEWALKCYT